MLKNRILIPIMLIVFLFTSASISAQSSYKTFGFLDFDIKVLIDIETRPENLEFLKAAIQRELEAKGLVRSDSPDLLVNIGVLIEEKVQTRETNARQDMHYMGQRNYHWEVEEVPVGTYTEGTVNIDLVDAAQNKRVWEGSASSVLVKKNTKMQKRIDQGIKKAFKKFSIAKL